MIRTIRAFFITAFVALVIGGGVVLVATAAMAQQCAPIQPDQFILQGMASIESGEVKGTAIIGDRAVAFAKVAELSPTIIAFFFINDIESPDVIMVVVTDKVACGGEPMPNVKDAYRKYIGQGA